MQLGVPVDLLDMRALWTKQEPPCWLTSPEKDPSKVDDVLLNKAASIERCVARAKEEYLAAGSTFATNFSRQDAAILNIQRACEAALHIAHHLIRRERLGVPQSARDTFDMLAAAHMS